MKKNRKEYMVITRLIIKQDHQGYGHGVLIVGIKRSDLVKWEKGDREDIIKYYDTFQVGTLIDLNSVETIFDIIKRWVCTEPKIKEKARKGR